MGEPFVDVATSVIGVLCVVLKTFGSVESEGYGASRRVIRDVPPHWGKDAVASGSGEHVSYEA